jgi:signal peptidase I
MAALLSSVRTALKDPSARYACASGVVAATVMGAIQSQICKIQGRSMQPTLVSLYQQLSRHTSHRAPGVLRQNDGCSSGEQRDLVFLDRLSARLNMIERGDVIVVRSPDDHALITKRVVAMGGDEVRPRDNSRRLVRVPTGHVWIEGDNSEVSTDSNHFGTVDVQAVHARVAAKVWPPSAFGLVR